MENVQKVYITSELAKRFDTSTMYIRNVVNHLLDYGYITDKDCRKVGNASCLYNERAVREIAKKLKREF